MHPFFMMTKEQFHSWCTSNLRLTRDDRRFFDYVWLQILDNHPITTAQNALWVRIIRKHYRQLQRVYSADEVKRLETSLWSLKPVETVQQHAISIETATDGQDYVTVKTPFNADMNRLMSHRIGADLRFSHGKGWYYPFQLRALGQAYRLLNSPRLRLCPKARAIISPLLSRKRRNWVPTVFESGDRWFISCITEDLAKYLPESLIPSLETAVQLAALGLDFSPTIRRQIYQTHGRLIASLVFNAYTVANLDTLTVARDIKVFCRETNAKKVVVIDRDGREWPSTLFSDLITLLRPVPSVMVVNLDSSDQAMTNSLLTADLVIAENTVPELRQFVQPAKVLYTANTSRKIISSRYYPRTNHR